MSIVISETRTAWECALRCEYSAKKTDQFESAVIRSKRSSCFH